MRYTFILPDMKCQHCAEHLTAALSNDGALNIAVELESHTLSADFPACIAREQVKERLKMLGYAPED